MVNQYQLFELLKFPTLSLFHNDLPYLTKTWSDPGNDPGFPKEMVASLQAIPAAKAESFDAVYRIGYPYARTESRAKRIVTFMVSEFAMCAEKFASGQAGVEHFCDNDNLVVTPSNWSKMKLLEYGFPEEKILVIPHGVNRDIFYPLTDSERQRIRSDLDLLERHFAFLNLGAMSDNKGVNYLLVAFSHIHRKHPQARLLLKDSSSIYGTTVADFVHRHEKANGPLSADVLNSIFLVPSHLSLQEMRQLYGAADAYVSPYRAEGFNLPVIEAIACGTPAIVTEGGATDDFCESSTSLKIRADRIADKDRGSPLPGYHMQPRIENLIEQMDKVLSEKFAATDAFRQGRQRLIDRFSWASAARQLEAVL